MAIVVFLLDSDLLYFALSIKTLLVGMGCLVFAVYIMLKSPEQLKQHPRLRRFKDNDWGQYFAAGLAFTAFSTMGILKTWPGSNGSWAEQERGLMLGLLFVVVIALVSIGLLKVIAKFRE